MARELNGKGTCEGCGHNFIGCVDLYTCPYGCEEPETFYCGECGDVEVAHDGDDCAECKAKFQRQQRRSVAFIKMLTDIRRKVA